jgi:cytochrome P450
MFFFLGLSRTEVMDEMLLFLSAGYSSTSAALAWFIFFMSKYPEVQSKLKRELAEYSLRRLSVEQLDSLPYLDCVFRELFRFVPPAVGTMRTLTADDRLPASGVLLHKGEQVFIPFFNLGRDPRYWSTSIDPDQFHPERFLTKPNDGNNKAASIAFGGGHRQCIGKDFVRLELKAISARLMQHVTFGDGGHEVNSGGYKETDSILPKHMGVTITFD